MIFQWSCGTCHRRAVVSYPVILNGRCDLACRSYWHCSNFFLLLQFKCKTAVLAQKIIKKVMVFTFCDFRLFRLYSLLKHFLWYFRNQVQYCAAWMFHLYWRVYSCCEFMDSLDVLCCLLQLTNQIFNLLCFLSLLCWIELASLFVYSVWFVY